jgi:hypothetical protein
MSAKRGNVLVLALLVLVGIGLLGAAVAHARAQANGRETEERMKKLALAMHACSDAHSCFLPPAFDSFADSSSPASVHAHLLPYLEQRAEADVGLDARLACFQSPSDLGLGTGEGVQNYAANLRVFSDAGVNSYGGAFAPVPLTAIMPGHTRFPATFIDGTSNTICFATKFAVCDQQRSFVIQGGSRYGADPTSPYAAFFGENAAERPAHPSDPEATFQLAPRGGQCLVWPLMGQSFGKKGITVALGDGSVRSVSPGISPRTWNYALQPNDGCCLSGDY